MEWLTLLAEHPVALESFKRFLATNTENCYKQALDADMPMLLALRGQRDAFNGILAYMHNNLALTKQQSIPDAEPLPRYQPFLRPAPTR